MGEIVFARLFGLDTPEPLSLISDGGVDFVLPSGATVDVKAISGLDEWRLGLLVPKRMRSGVYVLIHVSFSDVCTALGWQTGGYVAARGEDRGNHYRLAQRLLRPMGELI